MLSYINLLLIVIIIIVLVVDTIYIFRHKKDIDRLNTAITVRNANSLVDLDELKGLNPEFKSHYRKYIINGMMPPIITKVNQTIENEKINEYLSKNEYAINQQIKTFTDSL